MCSSPQSHDRLPVVSLATRNSRWTSARITILILAAHGLFLYAQAGGMDEECGIADPITGKLVQCPTDHVGIDGLMAGTISIHAEYTSAGVVKTGLDVATTQFCYNQGIYVNCTEGRESPILLPGQSEDIELCTILQCNGMSLEKPVMHLSYIYSIIHLWMQDGGETCPAYPGGGKPPNAWKKKHCTKLYPGRPSAACLFFFSFVWPHVKLLLLHLFYYVRVSAGKRRNAARARRVLLTSDDFAEYADLLVEQ